MSLNHDRPVSARPVPPSAILWLVLAGIGLLAFGSWQAGRLPWNSSEEGLIVYCAHDAEYSEPILQEFTRQTGIVVFPKFDTEATKSLSLVQLIEQEASAPRCDVFWNNEPLGTLGLAAQGLLEPYHSPHADQIPEQFCDPQDRWTGFAARFRVQIIASEDKLPGDDLEAAVKEVWDTNLAAVAVAKPLFGTTRVHYTALAASQGLDELQKWHRDVRKRGLREVNSNGATKNAVVQGHCLVGWTDTDDFFVGQSENPQVRMLPARVDGKTLCVPNTVAIIKGTGNKSQAQKLVDFLLSKETELALARSAARQVPLGPVASADLPEEVRELQPLVKEGYDLRLLDAARQPVLDWLLQEYLP